MIKNALYTLVIVLAANITVSAKEPPSPSSEDCYSVKKLEKGIANFDEKGKLLEASPEQVQHIMAYVLAPTNQSTIPVFDKILVFSKEERSRAYFFQNNKICDFIDISTSTLNLEGEVGAVGYPL